MKPATVLDILFYAVTPYVGVMFAPELFLETTLSQSAKDTGANSPYARYECQTTLAILIVA